MALGPGKVKSMGIRSASSGIGPRPGAEEAIWVLLGGRFIASTRTRW